MTFTNSIQQGRERLAAQVLLRLGTRRGVGAGLDGYLLAGSRSPAEHGLSLMVSSLTEPPPGHHTAPGGPFGRAAI
jgi:hypothetical protein